MSYDGLRADVPAPRTIGTGAHRADDSPEFFVSYRWRALLDTAVLTSGDGRGRTAAFDTFLLLNACHGNDGRLKIGESEFLIKTDHRGRLRLQDGQGTECASAIARSLSQISPSDDWSILHRPTPFERTVGPSALPIRSTGPETSAGINRLIQRAADRVRRQIERSARPLTSASLWRRLIRAAVSVLRQLLGLQGRQYPETPEAVTHSHVIDQHRTRGPSLTRKTSPTLVLGELAA